MATLRTLFMILYNTVRNTEIIHMDIEENNSKKKWKKLKIPNFYK